MLLASSTPLRRHASPVRYLPSASSSSPTLVCFQASNEGAFLHVAPLIAGLLLFVVGLLFLASWQVSGAVVCVCLGCVGLGVSLAFLPTPHPRSLRFDLSKGVLEIEEPRKGHPPSSVSSYLRGEDIEGWAVSSQHFRGEFLYAVSLCTRGGSVWELFGFSSKSEAEASARRLTETLVWPPTSEEVPPPVWRGLGEVERAGSEGAERRVFVWKDQHEWKGRVMILPILAGFGALAFLPQREIRELWPMLAGMFGGFFALAGAIVVSLKSKTFRFEMTATDAILTTSQWGVGSTRQAIPLAAIGVVAFSISTCQDKRMSLLFRKKDLEIQKKVALDLFLSLPPEERGDFEEHCIRLDTSSFSVHEIFAFQEQIRAWVEKHTGQRPL